MSSAQARNYGHAGLELATTASPQLNAILAPIPEPPPGLNFNSGLDLALGHSAEVQAGQLASRVTDARHIAHQSSEQSSALHDLPRMALADASSAEAKSSGCERLQGAMQATLVQSVASMTSVVGGTVSPQPTQQDAINQMLSLIHI